MYDGLGIALRPVTVAMRFKLRAELGVVVDLAVEDDPDGLVLVGERLVASRQINDAQPPVTEYRLRVREDPRIVWPAMGDDVAHLQHARAVIRVQLLRCDESCDSTHKGCYPLGRF